MAAINIVRIVGGKIVEQGVQLDTIALMQQLGGIPEPARRAAAREAVQWAHRRSSVASEERMGRMVTFRKTMETLYQFLSNRPVLTLALALGIVWGTSGKGVRWVDHRHGQVLLCACGDILTSMTFSTPAPSPSPTRRGRHTRRSRSRFGRARSVTRSRLDRLMKRFLAAALACSVLITRSPASRCRKAGNRRAWTWGIRKKRAAFDLDRGRSQGEPLRSSATAVYRRCSWNEPATIFAVGTVWGRDTNGSRR